MPQTTHTGSIKTGSAGAAEQAQAIGATIGPDGWWYLNGRKLSPQEADQLTQQAGVAQTTTDDAHGDPGGFRIGGDVGGLWERNKQDIGKYGGLAANLIPGVGPLAAAGIGAALNYGANHDLGKAAMAGASQYGVGKLAGMAGKLPGVSAIGDKIGKIPGASQIGNAAKSVGSWWDEHIKQPVQAGAASSGFKLPGVSDIAGFVTGNNGMNALGIAQGVNAADLQRTSTNYAKSAYDTANKNYQANAPLRDTGRAGMLNPAKPDLTTLTKTRGRNPFAVTPIK